MNNKQVSPRLNKVLLIYTGGTIGMGHNPDTGALEPLNFDHLLSNFPEFALLPTEVDTYQFTPPIDSSDMSLRRWAQLVRIIADNYEAYDGFVVLHGTDTMAYTASALSFMLENLTKPVILTGSQLPIGQLRTDGIILYFRERFFCKKAILNRLMCGYVRFCLFPRLIF